MGVTLTIASLQSLIEFVILAVVLFLLVVVIVVADAVVVVVANDNKFSALNA